MDESEMFFLVHADLPREGPGSDACTERAYSLIPHIPTPRILDIGCGPGMQTRKLARISGGHVTAVDNHPPFLARLQKSVEDEGLAERVEVVGASMFELPFADEEFDIIWSEGAIFVIGFQRGLREWRRMLKPGGAIAVTEVAWLKPNPPKEIFDYWTGCYPDIQSIDVNLRRVQEENYKILGNFTLPSETWWDEYYTPMAQRIAMLREQYADNTAMLRVIAESEHEIEMHRKYGEFYGYVFYVMQKG